MAVVESAADGRALTMPTLGLGLPRNFAHLTSESDQSELHHTHQHYHHHHHQKLQHHQPLLHQQHSPKSAHIDEDQQALHNSSSLLTQTEARTQVNADGLPSIDEISTRKLAFTSSLAQKSASSDDIPSNLTSVDGIALKSHGDMGLSGSQFKDLVYTKGELGSEKVLPNGVNHLAVDSNLLKSMYDQMKNMVNPQRSDDGKDLILPINPHDANANSLTQSEKDSMHRLEDQLSKLNPLAKEFIPSSFNKLDGALLATDNSQSKQKKDLYTQGRRRPNGKTSKAQREDSIRRTVYVSDIDQQVTEEQLAALFITCGPVVDCRVCGDPNSVLRFAFVEFTNEGAARAALGLAGTMLGYYPVRVLPSKTAIVPVNPTFLPHSEEELEMCARTIYCTNIDKKVSQADVKLFFETFCGEVARLRLLGDYRHSTRIAFVEFVRAESAMEALNCSGAILGSMPLRVSPSKTPVRPRSPRFL